MAAYVINRTIRSERFESGSTNADLCRKAAVVNTVYLDHNATTPVDPRVLEKMLPYFTMHFGNPSSASHAWGWAAKAAVDLAREQTASCIGASPDEIIFTSGATESIQIAIQGVFNSYCGKRKQVITAATEHSAVLGACRHLENQGAVVDVLPVLTDGTMDLQHLRNSLSEETLLVCIMKANHETGVIHPMRAISDMVHDTGALLFSDITQTIGKTTVDVQEDGIDLCCLSAHKFYGPKGAGALYIRRKDPRVNLTGFQEGGGQEKGLRSGTLNVPGVVGMGAAAELVHREAWDWQYHCSILRSRLEQGFLDTGIVSVNGNTRDRLSNTTNICFRGKSAGELIGGTPGIGVSMGSACSSQSGRPSHVLKAMGLSDQDAQASIRFSVGKDTRPEDIDRALAAYSRALSR